MDRLSHMSQDVRTADDLVADLQRPRAFFFFCRRREVLQVHQLGTGDARRGQVPEDARQPVAESQPAWRASDVRSRRSERRSASALPRPVGVQNQQRERPDSSRDLLCRVPLRRLHHRAAGRHAVQLCARVRPADGHEEDAVPAGPRQVRGEQGLDQGPRGLHLRHAQVHEMNGATDTRLKRRPVVSM